MSRDVHSLGDYVGHVLKAIERIRTYIEGTSKEAFLRNQLMQDAVVRNLRVIGEACNSIRHHFPAFAAQNPDLPLQAACEMRNALTDRYYMIDMDVIWTTVAEDMPATTAQFEALVDDLR
jgi:uncharacterized protein with HEPN domain